MKIKSNFFKFFSIATSWIWFGLFALTSTILIIFTSFCTRGLYTNVIFKFTLSNYFQLFDRMYINVLVNSITLAGLSTFICFIVGYPFTLIIARINRKWKHVILLLVIIPFWTSSLIRTYAIMSILKNKGIINTLLMGLGIIKSPLQLLYSDFAVLIGCVYDLLPFMILPLYTSVEKLDNTYLEAAKDLGANRFTIFFKIIIPLTKSGIMVGSVLVFLPSMTMFYIPVLLGSAKNLLLGNLIEYQLLSANNWPLSAAISILTIFFIIILFIRSYRRNF